LLRRRIPLDEFIERMRGVTKIVCLDPGASGAQLKSYFVLWWRREGDDEWLPVVDMDEHVDRVADPRAFARLAKHRRNRLDFNNGHMSISGRHYRHAIGANAWWQKEECRLRRYAALLTCPDIKRVWRQHQGISLADATDLDDLTTRSDQRMRLSNEIFEYKFSPIGLQARNDDFTKIIRRQSVADQVVAHVCAKHDEQDRELMVARLRARLQRDNAGVRFQIRAEVNEPPTLLKKERVMVFWGDWCGKQQRGWSGARPPLEELKRRIAPHAMIYVGDEYRSSKCCSSCKADMFNGNVTRHSAPTKAQVRRARVKARNDARNAQPTANNATAADGAAAPSAAARRDALPRLKLHARTTLDCCAHCRRPQGTLCVQPPMAPPSEKQLPSSPVPFDATLRRFKLAIEYVNRHFLGVQGDASGGADAAGICAHCGSVPVGYGEKQLDELADRVRQYAAVQRRELRDHIAAREAVRRRQE
jgi:hypothetical protein